MSNWWDAAPKADAGQDWWSDAPVERPSNAGNIPLDPAQRRVGEIYTDGAGRPRRWMGDSWAFDDAARETTLGEFVQGLGVDLLQGLTRAPEALADTIGWAFSGGQGSLLTPAAKAEIQGSRDYLEALKPAAYRGEQSIPIVKRDAEGGIAGIGLPSAESVTGTLTQSLPQVPMLVGAGGGLRTAAQGILPNSPRLAAALGYGGANAALVAPTGAEDVRMEALANGATPDQAASAANKAFGMLAPLTALTGGAGGALSAGQGQSTNSLARALIGGFLADAPFEGAEEAGQSAITDIALGRDVDAARAAEAGAQGVFAGGLPGAAIAALETRARPTAATADTDWYTDAPIVEEAPSEAPAAPAVDVPAPAATVPAAPDVVDPAAVAEPAPVEAAQEPAPVRTIEPTAEQVGVDADTGRGIFRLIDEVAPDGTDYSEFGQVRRVTAYDGETPVGTLVYANDGTPPTVNVEPEYQRRGIATAMYELARQQGGILGDAQGGIRGRAEQYRTPAGMAFRTGADASRITLAPARPAAVESAGAPPPAATPQAEPAPASPPVTTPAAGRDNPLPPDREGDAPVGAWVQGRPIPGVPDADLVRQVREVPISEIDATEFDSAGQIAPEKRADAERYAEMLRSGSQPPNARGAELPNGKIKLQDGHRRLKAAMDTGAKTLRVAVNPLPAPAPTSTKNRVTDAERAAESRDPILRSLRQSNEETVTRAREAMADNPSLVAEITARAPDAPISVTEEAALLIGKVEARNRREEAAAVIADPKATPERKAAAQRAWDDAEAEISRIDEANVARGREWGRLGQFRQRLMAADFTLEAMESKLRRAKGGALTAEETAGLKALSEKLQAAETDLAAARQKIAEYEQTVIVRETIEQAVRAATAQMRGAARSGKSKLEILKERADAARKRLAAAESVPSKRGQSGAVTNPVAMLADVIDIGVWHVANGAKSLGDWIKAMTADLGSRFTALQDRWPDLFAASKRANVPAKPDAPTTAEVLATIDPANVTREDVRDLVMARIRAGEKDADAIMRAVTADVQTVDPSLTEADVRQLFADYGKRASPTRDADKQTLRDLRTVVRLEKDIADAEAGLPRKTPVARQRASEEIRQLRARLSELLKQAARRARTPEAEAVLLAKRRDVLEKQIADLEDQVETGRRPAKRTRQAELAPDLAARRDELQREIRRIDAAMRPRRSPDEVYQQRRGTSIAREIERVQARIAAGDYARSPRVPKALNEANQEAFYRLEKLRQDFRSRQFFAELQQRSRSKRYLDNTASGLNLARAVMTSFDLSALLRQGGFVALGHPVRAAESIPDMLKAFASERAALKVENDIKDRDNAPLYKRAGLQITDDSGSLSKMEEAYMTRFLNKLERKPGQPARNFARTAFNVATAPVRGSARAYSTFLNKLRADSFDAMLASLQRGADPTDAEIKAIANYINVATGRGKVPLMSESAAAGLNTVFFAPKLVASRFQLLAGQPLYGGSNRTRAMIAQDYARYLTGVAVVYALGAMLNATLDEDEDDRRPFIELDPRSSSFGRMRFGDWFVDPLSGLAQVSTILARSIGGETKTAAGDVKPMRDNYRLSNLLYDTGEMLDRAGFESLAGAFPDEPNYDKMGIADQSVADAIGSFVRSKLAPVPGAVVNTLTAENMVGQATTPADEAVGLVTPMTFGNVADAMRDNGVAGGTALTMAEVLGMGVQFRDRSSFDAPDYADLDFQQRRDYSAYLQRTQNMKQDLQSLRDLANSFPEDASPSDVRDAVQMKAEQLGIDGIELGQYSRRTTARDERGIRKSGLKRTESGNVQLEYDKGSITKMMLDTEKSVNKINREMEDFIRQPMSDEMIDKKYREYVSGGEANGDKSLVIRQMRDQREQAIRLFMEAVNED